MVVVEKDACKWGKNVIHKCCFKPKSSFRPKPFWKITMKTYLRCSTKPSTQAILCWRLISKCLSDQNNFGVFFLSALSCNSFLAIQRENLQTSMEIVTSTYSSDLRNLIMYLLTNPTRVKSVNDLMPMIGE